MSLRIVGISSSPRHANTEILLRHALQAASEAYGVETELVSFKGKRVLPCVDCKACVRRRTDRLIDQCTLKDDWKELVRPLVDPVPAGVIIASPVYFFDVSSSLRAFMERFTSLFKAFWNEGYPFEPPDFSRTAAGALTIGFHRHGGQETAAGTIVNWILSCGFVAVGSFDGVHGPMGYIGGTAWQLADGQGGPEAVLNDDWGLRSAAALGERVAMTAALLQSGVAAKSTSAVR